MKLTVRHELTFDLGTPSRAQLHLLLTPLNTPQQKVERWSVDMPGIKEAAAFRDAYGNRAQLVTFAKPEGSIRILVEGTVECVDKAGVLGRLELDPVAALFRRTTAATKADPKLTAGLSQAGDRIATLHELMARVHTLPTAPLQEQSQGSQKQTATRVDPADAFVGAARTLGFAARHVTGYVFADDAGWFGSWAEVWEDGLGWIGFDPTLDVCPADSHVRVASGLDAMSCVPVRSVPVWDAMPDETVTVTAE